jgi:parallel beta-helix repeat protein
MNSKVGILINAGDNFLRNNTMENNGSNLVIWGGSISYLTQDIDTSNTVDGKIVYYLINKRSLVVDPIAFPNAGYLGIVNSTNLLIQNFKIISSCGEGLLLGGVTNSTIKNNVIAGALEGIMVGSSSDNRIENNTVTDSWWGIWLGYSSDENSIKSNVINRTIIAALMIWDGSSNNTIECNHLPRAGGSYGPADIYVSKYCSDNRIFHNNFFYVEVSCSNRTNVFDNGYPSGGNYWDDYKGVDINGDGVGDTLLPHKGLDNYPLMGPFSDFNVNWEEETYHITTICNSTISAFKFNGTAIRLNISGENGTVGFCRICIPTALMNGSYRVFVDGTEVDYGLLPFSNGTHHYLYFNCTLSTKEIVIVPEFPSVLILPLFIIATLSVVVIHKKRNVKIERLVQIRKTG